MVTKIKVTQADIAKHAGVSRAAVSLALSARSDTSLSADTRTRILNAAEQLGYAIKPVAVQAAAANKEICLIFPNAVSQDTISSLCFHIPLLHTNVVEEVEQLGHRISLSISDGKEIVPDMVQNGPVDGIIIEMICSPQWAQRLAERVPTVMLNFPLDDLPIDSVMPDNAAGIRKIVQHLVEFGHRRIAVFGMEPRSHQFSRRIAAFLATVQQLQLPFSDELLSVSIPQTRDFPELDRCAAAALDTWMALPDPPTAIVALNDTFAWRLMREAQARGLRIPQDISLAGFDNNPQISLHTDPGLTTVDHSYAQMGRIATRLLFDRINNPSRPCIRALVDVSLVVRESTGPVPTR